MGMKDGDQLSADEDPLNIDQRQRAQALMEAKLALAAESLGDHHRAAVDALDAYNLAAYIVTGEDPWADNRPQEATP